jgi:hypothetical protein
VIVRGHLEGQEATREELEYHYVGGLLNGALAPPGSAVCTIDRFRRVEEACIALDHVDGEVRLERVADVLHELGVYAELGGTAFLVDLMEAWLERVARARELGELLARAEVAAHYVARERRMHDAAVRAAEELHAARDAAEHAWRSLAAVDWPTGAEVSQ